MAVTIQSILQQHFDDYFRRHRWPSHVRRAVQRMRDCRTAAMGGHVERCPNGHVQKVHYNSCHHRSCPACNALPGERWLRGWKARLLQTGHHHLVLTVPHKLNDFWRYNRALFARLLFSAVRESLLELLADKKYLGGRPGMLAALHTWGQLLPIHLHLHVLVTAGGLGRKGDWRRPKKKCLLPRNVLMQVYRGKLRAKLRRAAERGELVLPPTWRLAQFCGLLNKLGRVKWNVKIFEAYEHGEGVATYVAGYAKGGPIKNQRLLAQTDGEVTFRYRDNQDKDDRTGRGRLKTTNMSADEFISRLLEHVPPKGMRTVRAWGLYASSKRDDLATARTALGQAPPETPEQLGWQDFLEDLDGADRTRCPVCGAELIVASVFPRERGPPADFSEDAA